MLYLSLHSEKKETKQKEAGFGPFKNISPIQLFPMLDPTSFTYNLANAVLQIGALTKAKCGHFKIRKQIESAFRFNILCF